MATCKNCGNEVEAGVKFCPACGKECTGNNTSGNTDMNGMKDSLKSLLNTADHTSRFDPQDINDNKILSLFSYLSILFVIPLVASPGSKFARFHANQGILLFLATLAVCIPFSILNFISGLFVIFKLVLFPLYIAYAILLAFAVFGVVNALNGKAKELPIIGRYTVLK